ncbi:MAG: DUF1549 domain-containing protein [Verrucomicrobiae bacterium]|nr:DUF1549 domain-containing protein [Verrucomicrobiae bacterium]MCP5541046.1 DUF1549 domain-containing protein [Akkermansiaceae bacterium]
MKSAILSFVAMLALSAGPAIGKTASPDAPSAQVDALLARFWKQRGVEPNPVVDDATFLRRIYLDVAGRIPTVEETRAFLADQSPKKRAALIDALLDSEAYVSHYYNYWADILRINQQQGGGQNVVPAYIQYVKNALRENKPYDQFVRDLVTAEGGGYENGAIGYYYRDRGMPLDNMANTIRVFLGTRLECAQCHNHPFDKWTQMDFYHMASFSYGVTIQGQRNAMSDVQQTIQRNTDLSNQEKSDLRRAFQEISRPLRNNQIVSYNGDRLAELPHDYKYDDAKPKEKIEAQTIFGANPEVVSPGAKLDEYAKWMTSPENPRFTTVIANRLFKRAMGQGLIEPVDEFLDETVPASPELMEFLTRQMIAYGYDMKAYLRMLFNTKAYQREAVSADLLEPTDYAFTGPLLRRMSAEQIWDSLVTLVNPDPEAGNWKQALELQVRDANYQMLTAAIESKTPDQLIADAKTIAQRQKGIQEELDRIQKAQVKARQNKETQKARELAQETNRLRTDLRTNVFNTVYKPALAKAAIEVASLELPEDLGEIEMKPDMVDDNGRPTRELRDRIQKAENTLAERQLDSLGIADDRDRRNMANYLRNVNNTWLRAANLQTPAPANHFLRQFGQSDRETIQNAEDAASVPQALTMLNSNIFETVTNGASVIGRAMAGTETPESKIETLFLGLLNRPPTAEETALVLADLESRGDDLFKDTAFALLNSQEFYFVK